jgi:hypothetical protein
MANVLTVPNSGIISFDGNNFSNLSVPPLSSSVRLSYDNGGGINITSLNNETTALDRFTVDGTQGRLFSVTDVLTGVLFSVNDISGFPILEVKDTDTVTIGEYNSNALVVSGNRVGIQSLPHSTNALTVNGTISTSQHGTSENWGTTFSTVQTNSASWEESADILPTVTNYLSTNNVLISSLTITNNLSVEGTLYSSASANVLVKFTEIIGNGTNFTVNHNFNTTDVQVQVFRVSDGVLSYPTIEVASENAVTIKFAQTIPSSSYRVVIYGSVPSNQINAYGEIYTFYITATGFGDIPSLSANWTTAYNLATAISSVYVPEYLAIAYAVAL